MPSPLRSALLGSPWTRRRLVETATIVALTAIATFLGYALEVFNVAGGVVFIAWDAAVFGVVVAALLAARGHGLVVAWAITDAAQFGYAMDHYLLGIPHQPLPYRLQALLSPDRLAFFAVVAVVVGTLAWTAGRALGSLASRLVDAVSTDEHG